jgi:hypothetical protein
MNVDIGTEVAKFLEKEHINGIFVAVYEYEVIYLLTKNWQCFSFHYSNPESHNLMYTTIHTATAIPFI